MPFVAEAADAAIHYLSAQRKHLVLSAEIGAKHSRNRVLFALGAAMLGHLTLLLVLLWFTQQLHDSGVPAWGVALLCLVVLGGTSALLARAAKRGYGRPQLKSRPPATEPLPTRRSTA